MLNHDDQRLRTTYGPPGAPHPDEFAALNVYECGARMLDRLHSILGPARFSSVLMHWPVVHRFGNVNRSEWISYLNHATGRSLSGFVHRWLMSPTTPQ
jgi:aminopeptidase N